MVYDQIARNRTVGQFIRHTVDSLISPVHMDLPVSTICVGSGPNQTTVLVLWVDLLPQPFSDGTFHFIDSDSVGLPRAVTAAPGLLHAVGYSAFGMSWLRAGSDVKTNRPNTSPRRDP